MRKTWYRTQGNINDKIVVPITGVAAVNGVGSTAVAYVKRGADKATLACTLTGQLEVTVLLGNASGWLATCHHGDWDFSIKITFGDGSSLNWPDGPDPDRISVRRKQD